MKKIVIFGGTTEGKLLSKMFSEAAIYHTVCVATSYGRGMMKDSPYAEIIAERMDYDRMTAFLGSLTSRQNLILVDATHPYAHEVTENIRRICSREGYEYIRILRDEGMYIDTGAVVYEDIKDCAGAIECTKGNILLTTGTKSLPDYCRVVSSATRSRTYVRVLPSAESLEICRQQQIEADHIIAMQGPFSEELNEAVIRQYHIEHLITKDSGSAGGFDEKAEAAKSAGAALHVIKRPIHEEGISVCEAYRLITGREVYVHEKELVINLVGTGMGWEDGLTLQGRKAIISADCIFGTKRLLEGISAVKKITGYLPEDIIPVIESENFGNVAIVFSGDTGFYSGASRMYEALKERFKDVRINLIPGTSSVSYLAAKTGVSYEDACLFSLHGRGSDRNLAILCERVRASKKVFVLLSGSEDVRRIGKALSDAAISCRLFVGANMSYENESITSLSPIEAMGYRQDGVITLLILNDDPKGRFLIPVKRDTEFIRGDIPMTKEIIRHESIIRLQLREGDVFYDIGGGTGSVAIEAAALSSQIDVVTFEKKPEAAELIRKNIERAGLHNITVVEGNAGDALKERPAPDCVFIGGSGGELFDILKLLNGKRRGIRYVINAVSLETIDEVRDFIKKYDPLDAEQVMISVTDVRKAGDHHLMQGQNPVWIFSFTL